MHSNTVKKTSPGHAAREGAPWRSLKGATCAQRAGRPRWWLRLQDVAAVAAAKEYPVPGRGFGRRGAPDNALGEVRERPLGPRGNERAPGSSPRFFARRFSRQLPGPVRTCCLLRPRRRVGCVLGPKPVVAGNTDGTTEFPKYMK